MKLTRDEIVEFASDIGEAHNKLAEHTSEADAARKRLKEKENELQRDLDRIAGILRSGHEPRLVLVEAYANFQNGKFEEVRTDTGEVVNRRPLSPNEKQGEFDLELWREDLHKRMEQVGQAIVEEAVEEKSSANP